MKKSGNGKKQLGARIVLEGVSSYTDVRGKKRWRYRSKGRTISLKGQPGTPEFMESYNSRVLGNVAKKPPARVVPYSIRDLVSNYMQGRHWREGITESTRKSYRGLLSDICLLYTSPSPRDQRGSRMPSSA